MTIFKRSDGDLWPKLIVVLKWPWKLRFWKVGPIFGGMNPFMEEFSVRVWWIGPLLVMRKIVA